MSLFKDLQNFFHKEKQLPVTTVEPQTKAHYPDAQPKKDVAKEEEKETPASGTVLRQESVPQIPDADSLAQEETNVKNSSGYNVGELIDNRYKIESIMSGSMGYVYISKDTKQRITFAIKQPKNALLGDHELFARVVQEADAWTRLGMHPNIAYCYFVKAIAGVPHIFIEYVDGGSLEEWISDRRCADYQVGLDMAVQFCHGMERAHERGMIHRDIKPTNILVTQGGLVKVTDFGLVGGVKTSGSAGVVGDLHGTRMGDTMGTPAYMPPEQWNDPRQKSSEATTGVWQESDVYSFGVCLWEMFCGRRPYEISIGMKGKPPEPRDLRRDIPDTLRELLLKSVELDREKREKNFGELKEDLNKVYQELYGSDAPSYQLELHDTTADELNNQGYSYYELGKKEEARKCFEAAVEVNNTHPEAVFNLTLLQWRGGEIDDLEALRRVRNCLNHTFDRKKKISELLAYIHVERFDPASAKEVLNEYHGRFDELFGGITIQTMGLIRTFEGHTESVYAVALSPDGRYALSGSRDNTLKLWDVKSGLCLRTFEGHSHFVTSLSVNNNFRYAFSGSEDKMLKLWNIETGQCLHTFNGYRGGVLSPDGRYALMVSSDETLKLLVVETGECLRTFEGHSKKIASLCWSQDGKYALSGDWDHILKLWDVPTGKCLRTIIVDAGIVSPVSLSTDGKYALIGKLQLWDVENGVCIRTFNGHRSGVCDVSLSLDGRYALSGSNDQTIKFWEVKTGRCLRTLEGHSEFVHSVSLSIDSRYALSGSSDHTLKLWNIWRNNTEYTSRLQVSGFMSFEKIKQIQQELRVVVAQAKRLMRRGTNSTAFHLIYEAWLKTGFQDYDHIVNVYQQLYTISTKRVFSFGYEEKTLEGHSSSIASVCISSDGRYALSGSEDKTLKLWDIETGQNLRTFKGHSDKVTSANMSADGRYVLSGSFDKTLKLWDITTGECLRTFEGHTEKVTSLSLSADGIHVFSGSGDVYFGKNDSTLRLWNIETGACQYFFGEYSGVVTSVSLSRDGRYGLSGNWDHTLKLWDVKTGHCLRTYEGHDFSVYSVSLSADGRYALSGSLDNTLKLWEISTGLCLRTFEGHSGSVRTVCLSADGKYGLSGGEDGTIKLWEVSTGLCLRTFEGQGGDLNSLCLSADGRYALSGSYDNTLKLWRLIWKLEFDE